MVIEGEIPPNETHSEGPFGEWTGYYAAGEREMPVINVKSVIWRNEPIVLGCLPGKPPNDNTYFRSPLRAAMLWDELEKAGIPGIVGAWSHEAGGGRVLNVISIKQLYPGHAKQVGHATTSIHAGAYANRFVIVVDDDIDPTDTNEVLWALCTRTEVTEDIDIVKRMWSTSLDPMAYAGEGPKYYNNRMIIDACRPYDRLETFPLVARTSQKRAERLRTDWSQLFTADGKVKKGVNRVLKS